MTFLVILFILAVIGAAIIGTRANQNDNSFKDQLSLDWKAIRAKFHF